MSLDRVLVFSEVKFGDPRQGCFGEDLQPTWRQPGQSLVSRKICYLIRQKVADTSKSTDNSKKKTKKTKQSTAPKEATTNSPAPTTEKPKREKVGFYWEYDLHEEARSCAHHVSEFVNILR